MPQVTSYTKQDGTSVRTHSRKGRPRSGKHSREGELRRAVFALAVAIVIALTSIFELLAAVSNLAVAIVVLFVVIATAFGLTYQALSRNKKKKAPAKKATAAKRPS